MLSKPSYNSETRTFDFSPQLASGETVTTASVVITDSVGTTVADMVTNVAPYGDTGLTYRLSGGLPDRIYTRHFRVTTSTGNVLEESVDVMVI